MPAVLLLNFKTLDVLRFCVFSAIVFEIGVIFFTVTPLRLASAFIVATGFLLAVHNTPTVSFVVTLKHFLSTILSFTSYVFSSSFFLQKDAPPNP